MLKCSNTCEHYFIVLENLCIFFHLLSWPGLSSGTDNNGLEPPTPDSAASPPTTVPLRTLYQELEEGVEVSEEEQEYELPQYSW